MSTRAVAAPGARPARALFLLLAAAACCDSTGPATRVPARVVAAVDAVTIGLGDTLRLGATVLDASDRVIVDSVAAWRSLDPARLSIGASSGLVTALDTGTARVVARAGAHEDTVGVTITRRVASVTLTFAADSMFSGASSLAATAEARDANGQVVANAPLLWTTGDSAILTVNEAGAVRAWQEGATTLRVTSGSVVATKQVRSVYRRLRFGALRPEQLSLGSQHGCALDADGRAYCWGLDSQGQLGRGSVFNVSTLAPVTGGHVFSAIEARDVSTCGLTTARQLRCWGRNAGATRSGTPTAVLDTVTVQAFAVGMHNQSCAIGVDAVTRCWGHNDTYQLGRGPLSGYDAAPLPVAGTQAYAASVSLGGFGGCAIGTDASTWCWGDMNGVTPGADDDRPVKVAGAPAFVQVESFINGGSCGRTGSGEVWCWGENYGGQLGFSSPDRSITPLRVAGLPALTRIDTGYGHGCGITAGGELWCWGGLGLTDQGWRLASGTRVARFAAPRVFRAFATSSSGVCGITVLDETICSGSVVATGL